MNRILEVAAFVVIFAVSAPLVTLLVAYMDGRGWLDGLMSRHARLNRRGFKAGEAARAMKQSKGEPR